MNITIRVIPPTQHRPFIDGADWFFDENGDLQVRVSKMSDWRRECILAVHEAVEAILCRHNGVKQADVDQFDKEYAQTHPTDLNAGDDPAAPYKREHCFATAVERLVCAELDVDWISYDKEIEGL